MNLLLDLWTVVAVSAALAAAVFSSVIWAICSMRELHNGRL